MGSKADEKMIEFVIKTTEAITIMAESSRKTTEAITAIKDLVIVQSTANAVAFTNIDGKMDGLVASFKYVIQYLIVAIVSLVGIKMLFKL